MPRWQDPRRGGPPPPGRLGLSAVGPAKAEDAALLYADTKVPLPIGTFIGIAFLRAVAGRYEIETPERQSALEARRHILAWVLTRIEQLGGRRIALHLLAEVTENLTPAAQETYRLLLAPGEGADRPAG